MDSDTWPAKGRKEPVSGGQVTEHAPHPHPGVKKASPSATQKPTQTSFHRPLRSYSVLSYYLGTSWRACGHAGFAFCHSLTSWTPHSLPLPFVGLAAKAQGQARTKRLISDLRGGRRMAWLASSAAVGAVMHWLRQVSGRLCLEPMGDPSSPGNLYSWANRANLEFLSAFKAVDIADTLERRDQESSKSFLLLKSWPRDIWAQKHLVGNLIINRNGERWD